MEYKLERDEHGEIKSCDCCACDVPTSLFDKPLHLQSEASLRLTVSEKISEDDQFRYCEVCAGTFISGAHGYPTQHYEDGHVLICMAQCVNMILGRLDRIERRMMR